MLEELKSVWEECSDNFYENVQRIKLFLLTLEYVKATGDVTLLQSLYPKLWPPVEG